MRAHHCSPVRSPSLPSSLAHHRSPVLNPTSSVKSSINGKPLEQKHLFTFDRTFGPASTQEDVFDEVSMLVQSALDGYRVSIFAYGQTGSGKTHTMIGDPNDEGIIPRSVRQIFETAEKDSERGWRFAMKAVGRYYCYCRCRPRGRSTCRPTCAPTLPLTPPSPPSFVRSLARSLARPCSRFTTKS